MPWVVLVVGIELLLAIHVTFLALGSSWAKLAPEVVQFGLGPSMTELDLRGVKVRVGWVPLGGWVSHGQQDAPIGRRLVPVFIAAAVVLGIGTAALGPTGALDVARQAVVLPITGAVSPSGVAQEAIARVVAGITMGDHRLTLGTTAVALGVWNAAFGTLTAVSTASSKLQILAPLGSLVLAVPWLFAWAIYLL